MRGGSKKACTCHSADVLCHEQDLQGGVLGGQQWLQWLASCCRPPSLPLSVSAHSALSMHLPTQPLIQALPLSFPIVPRSCSFHFYPWPLCPRPWPLCLCPCLLCLCPRSLSPCPYSPCRKVACAIKSKSSAWAMPRHAHLVRVPCWCRCGSGSHTMDNSCQQARLLTSSDEMAITCVEAAHQAC